jgi:hypothetical protein
MGKQRPALEGKQFGLWTVIAFARTADRDDKYTRWWRVRCVCGTERTQREWVLTNGKSTRCGECAAREHGERMARKQAERLIGQVFGTWTVVAYAGRVEHNGRSIAMWTCACTACPAVADIPLSCIGKPTMPACRHGIIPTTTTESE